MTITTIKVSTEVRDRLKEQASAENRTLGQHLTHLADLGERQRRLARVRTAIESTSADDLASYAAEVENWDRIDRA
ncbi:hypothetical protein [Aeromicrobium sp. CF3.5]|uniref:hypothetical protein n=1 Tax=Aeromicrobium sp. CF3.5 TaxID=3373078 RepID=UPI003EE494AE